MTTVRTVCPLNCPDCCSLLVEVIGDKVKVHGDMQTMGVNGFICPKGRALGDSVFSPDRLRHPILKANGGFQRISWDKAFDIVCEKIRHTLDKSGSQAILHMFDNGHNGKLRELDRRFFQALGGVTEPRGDMCWGAGYKAQEKDFGAVYSSEWEDMLNSKVIVLWGRDPAVTNKHLIPILRQAADNGAHIAVINPLCIKSTAFAHEYIRINPGTDGILALGIAHIILKERWMDFDFVKENTINFGSFAALVKEYPPERAAAVTGVPLQTMERLARLFTKQRPVMYYLGYGLQRYINGGNTVRAIDALAAITGNIGCPGAGVFYAHQYHKEKLNSLLLLENDYKNRTFPHATIAADLLKKENMPAIELAFITRSNPLVTEPDSVSWRKLWNSIPFKVTFERRMSDTAALSDLVLPITTIFEEEDIVATSWSNLIHYAPQVLKPLGEAKSESLVFTELARRFGLDAYFHNTPTEWIEYIIEPLKEQGITLQELKKSPQRAPYIPKTAWEDKKFLTPSGKIELVTIEEFFDTTQSPVEAYFEKKALISYLESDIDINKKDLKDSNSKLQQELPVNRHEDRAKVFYLDNYKAGKMNNTGERTGEYPYILITPHSDMALNTQFQLEQGFIAYIHSKAALACGIVNGDKIFVETEIGQLEATVYISDDIHEQTVVIPEGTTEKYLGVNCLIPGRLSELGESTAYYDTFCQIRKSELR